MNVITYSCLDWEFLDESKVAKKSSFQKGWFTLFNYRAISLLPAIPIDLKKWYSYNHMIILMKIN